MSTYSTPIPGVPQYGQAALAAKTAYQNALTRLNQRRGSLLRDAGFAGDINADSGVVQNVRPDGGNKYGAFQQLNRQQAQRADAAQWEGIDRGLGSGGGLAAQLRSNARYDFGKQDSDLAKGLLEGLAGFQDEQNSAAYQRDAALYQAELEAARLAIQNEDFNPADYSGLEYPEYGENPMTDPVAPFASAAAMTPAEKALAARSRAMNKQAKNPNSALMRAAAAPRAAARPAPKKNIEQTRVVNAVKAAQAQSKKKGR